MDELLMYYKIGLTYKQIANLMQITEENVITKLRILGVI